MKNSKNLSIPVFAAAIVLFAAVVFSILFHYGVIDFSEKKENDTVLPGDGGRFEEALRKGSTDTVKVTYDLHGEDLESLLRNNPPITSYYLANTFSRFADGKTLTGSNRIWRDGEKFRVQTYSENELIRTVICDGFTVSVQENGSVYEFQPSEHFDVESFASMPRSRDFLDSSDVTDLSITLFRDESDTLAHISFVDRRFGQIERLFLSIEYGIVLRAETYLNAQILYSLSTTEFTPSLDGFQTDSLFRH